MMQLLVEQPQRMAREKRLLEELAQQEKWLTLLGWGSTDGGDLCLHFSMQLPSVTHEATLVYPAHFPEVPAYIHPRDKKSRWSGHQYGNGGNLCLERGPDNWDSSVTGADLVRSANKLLWGEFIETVAPGALPIESRHAVTLGQLLRCKARRFLITPAFQARLDLLDIGESVPLKACTTFLGDASVTFAKSHGDPDALLPGVPAFPVLEVLHRAGWVIGVSLEDFLRPVTSEQQLRELLGERWPIPEGPATTGSLILLNYGKSGLRAFAVAAGNQQTFGELAVIYAPVEPEQRQPTSFPRLADKKVMFVGLGSMGSKVAISLARAGVGNVVLLDDDVLMPENMVRNGLSWRAVGFDKVQGVAADVRMVAPSATVSAVTFSVGGQENPSLSASFGDFLRESDLVVDCTAAGNAFVALASACKRAKKPMVWAEVFGGGIGGLIARSRPGLDADPLSIRSHISGVLGTLTPVPEEMRLRRVNYESGEKDAAQVASDADVTVMAGHLAQFALDVLTNEESEYPESAYLIGFKRAWEFKQPFDTIPIDCAGAHRQADAWAPLSVDEEAAIAELQAALQPASNAANLGTG